MNSRFIFIGGLVSILRVRSNPHEIEILILVIFGAKSVLWSLRLGVNTKFEPLSPEVKKIGNDLGIISSMNSRFIVIGVLVSILRMRSNTLK